jgi:hypothetical protein
MKWKIPVWEKLFYIRAEMAQKTSWGNDFFGTLNELPREPVDGSAHRKLSRRQG